MSDQVAAGELVDGRYELTELLGRGGMGEVWAAYDQRLDRSVAVKLLTPPTEVPGRPRRLDPQDPAVVRFTREARLMARLEHPCVPVIHDAGTHRETRLYLVMQRVYGHTLEELVTRRGPFPVEWAARVGAQICSVLAEAHGRGFVHRDLTPRNVMLTADGTVRVLDFGIAVALHPPDGARLTGPGTVAGTPGFVSPEQSKGQPATPLSDLYALGCVLYEILGGRPPFTAEDAVVMAVRHLTDDPAPLSRLRRDVPPALCDLVSRLLTKQPEGRPASAVEVQRLLTSWAEPAVPKLASAQAPALLGEPVPRGTGPADSGPAHDEAAPDVRPLPPVSAAAPPGSPDARERAHDLARQGRLTQALELLDKDLDAVLPRFAADHPEVVARRLVILRLRFEAQELQAARHGCLELAGVLARTRPMPDADLAACRVIAARCLGRLGHNSAALRELREALNLQRQVLPPLHPEVLETRREIATLLAGSGSAAEALTELRSLAADQRTALPADHPAHTAAENLISRLSRLTRGSAPSN
ncbi:serine/threonine-protein kinase [Streptomyces aidingensis]|uniref:non-specific serine/threonine protein kinase n=1 Tax=Streptomyces aidingensis TaxID=910347 RepID=A0A1I1UQC0_9ACTN|nr:serine/threonine-protein kinase [Streptomyces aidingensis]SFD72894.1 Serine/threonine protein kinase [Streptomyces aidingensis]